MMSFCLKIQRLPRRPSLTKVYTPASYQAKHLQPNSQGIKVEIPRRRHIRSDSTSDDASISHLKRDLSEAAIKGDFKVARPGTGAVGDESLFSRVSDLDEDFFFAGCDGYDADDVFGADACALRTILAPDCASIGTEGSRCGSIPSNGRLTVGKRHIRSSSLVSLNEVRQHRP